VTIEQGSMLYLDDKNMFLGEIIIQL